MRLSLLGGTAVAAAWAGAASAQTAPNVILPDGRTRTQLSVSGNTTGITTGTVSGANAFNSFSQFQVGTGNTVNLVVPTGARTLLNLVRNGQTVVNGTLNGVQGGKIGGNIYFADPYGFLVGPGGTINTGSLTVTTPTQAFIDQLLAKPGHPDATATQALLDDATPVSPDGVILVQGRINAKTGVRLHGQTVTVAARALSAAPLSQRQVFDASVNTSGLQRGGSISVSHGEIDIVAADAVEIGGTLRADGSAGIAGGTVSVAAGGDIHVAASALVSARGVGRASNGGTVRFKAGRNLVVANGAAVNVAGGSSGNGGSIELSAVATATIGQAILDAGASNGVAGSVLIDPTDLVIGAALGNTASIDTGGANETLLASNSITINGYLNTRKTASGGANNTSSASTGNSGNITLTAPLITINGSLNASATSGFTAGTILLDAEATASAISGFQSATAAIIVNGSIAGGNVTLQAMATATVSYDKSLKALNTGLANGKFTGITMNALAADANASVLVNASASITSSGTVAITATGTQTASTGSTLALSPGSGTSGSGTGTNIGFEALYGANTGIVSATVLGSVSAAGALTVTAHDTATIDLDLVGTSSTTGSAAFGGALGFAYANIATSASVGSGATITASSLNVIARNDSSFSNTASISLVSGGSGGAAAVAVNDITTAATAHLGASIGGTAGGSVGNVLVEADSVTAIDLASSSSTVKTAAASGTTPPPADPTPVASSTDSSGVGSIVTGLLGTGSTSDGGSDPAAASGASSSSLRVAADFTLALEHQTATANIAADTGKAAPVVKATGAVAVLSQLVDGGVWDGAASAQAVQKAADGSSPTGSATGITAALNLTFLTNTAIAYVGAGSVVSGTDVGVASSVTLPLNNTTFACADSNCSVLDILKAMKTDATLDKHLNSYVSATGTSNGTTITGSVDIFEITNTSQALIGDDATITSTATGASSWQTTQDNGAAWVPLTPVYVTWDKPVSVIANTITETASIAGDACKTFACTPGATGSTSNTGTAAGGSFAYLAYANTTTAEIGAGASVTAAGSVEVHAETTDFLVGIVANSGSGGANELSGIVAMNEIDDATHAAISNTAYVTAPAVAVTALQDLTVWAATGELLSSNSASVGLSVALSNVATDTRAFVGDDSADLASLPASPTGLTAAPLAEIATGALAVQATTDGAAGAVSLAATKTSSADAPPSKTATTSKFSGITSKISSARSGLAGALGGSGVLGGYAGTVAAGSNPPQPPAQPSYGLAVSGSSSVMLSGITTEAYLTGATVVGYAPGSVANVTDVQALDDATLLAASGAAALVSANASSVKNSVAVAGTVAFLQNQNATLAFISGHANITSAGVTVAALTGGTEVAAGLGVSVNTSKNTSGTNLSVAGSVSIMLIQQATNAYIADSTVTAAGAAAPATVEAYSDTKLGIGGGALAFGRGDAVGATITYLELDDPSQSGDNTGLAIDAKISGATLSGFGAVTVDAGDAQKIAAGALMVAGSVNGDAFGGVAVVNIVNGTTSAEIVNDGATAALVTNAGSVLVAPSGRTTRRWTASSRRAAR